MSSCQDSSHVGALEHWLQIFKVNITELVEPEVVQRGGGGGEVVRLEAGVAELHGVREAGQDPPVLGQQRRGLRLGDSFASWQGLLLSITESIHTVIPSK